MDLSRIFRQLYGAGQTDKDWHAPEWNTPRAMKFIETEKRIAEAFTKLREIESALDTATQQEVVAEFDERYAPTDARLGAARFQSDEWQQAWQEFLDAVHKAEELNRAHVNPQKAES